MGDKKKKKEKKKAEEEVELAEYKVSMYCNACERLVAKTISKIKGVEKFMTDMRNHRVVVMGRIKPQKVLKKLKKKTGKRVEIVKNDEDVAKEEEDSTPEGYPKEAMDTSMFDKCGNNSVCTMFNDENANACLIM